MDENGNQIENYIEEEEEQVVVQGHGYNGHGRGHGRGRGTGQSFSNRKVAPTFAVTLPEDNHGFNRRGRGGRGYHGRQNNSYGRGSRGRGRGRQHHGSTEEISSNDLDAEMDNYMKKR